MTTRLPFCLLLLLAAVAARQDRSHIVEGSAVGDLVRADVDASSFSAVHLHEDKDFS
jgi:hypothetical protein